MDKVKLVVSMEDERYRLRFVKCFMNHYKDAYELYVVDDLKKLENFEADEFEALVISDNRELLTKLHKDARMVFLQEDASQEFSLEADNIVCTQKYQEVYKIVEKLEMLIEKKSGKKNLWNEEEKNLLIGVFSLEKESMQLPFSVLLAETLGDQGDVLLMDLQPYSGLGGTETDTPFGLEDLLSVATTEVYTTNRLMASIGHEQKWDYIYPVKNISCLAEVGEELYQKVINMMFNERGYERIIVNFGAVFSGVTKLMERCDQFYFLRARGDACRWRENAFLEELHRQGKEEFQKKISWIEIPMEFIREKSWSQLAKSWLWSELGDQIREQNWTESRDGEYM